MADALPAGLEDGILIAPDGSLTSGKWTLGLLSGPMGVPPGTDQHILRKDDLRRSLCGLAVGLDRKAEGLGPDFGWRVPFAPLSNPWCASCTAEVQRVEAAGRIVRPAERQRRAEGG